MANQDPRGCGLLALVALVAVVAFLGGRASVSWPGEPAVGAGGVVAPAIVATTLVPAPFPTPRAVSIPRGTPPPTVTSNAGSGSYATVEPTASERPPRAARTREAAQPDSAPAPSDIGGGPMGAGCDPAYPTVCIPPPPPDLDCSVTTERNFEVLLPDPHGLDSDGDGVGCEPIRGIPGQPPGFIVPPQPVGGGAAGATDGSG